MTQSKKNGTTLFIGDLLKTVLVSSTVLRISATRRWRGARPMPAHGLCFFHVIYWKSGSVERYKSGSPNRSNCASGWPKRGLREIGSWRLYSERTAEKERKNGKWMAVATTVVKILILSHAAAVSFASKKKRSNTTLYADDHLAESVRALALAWALLYRFIFLSFPSGNSDDSEEYRQVIPAAAHV